MAEVVVTEIVKLILEKPISQVYKGIIFAKDLDTHIKLLQDSKAIIEAALLDANALNSCSHVQQDMLDKLGRALVKWDAFVDEKATRAILKELMAGSGFTTKVRSFFSPSNKLITLLKDTRKVKAIRGELDYIAKDFSQFGTIFTMVSEKKSKPLSQETGFYPTTDVIIGRDRDRDYLIPMLCDSSNGHESLSVVTIVGIGGQGKTTLAQYVFNDDRVKHCFDVRLWVFATPDFSVREILEKIIADAIDEKPFNCEMAQLQRRIMRAVAGKKFLLVLDNIWDQDKLSSNWLELKALLGVGASGSKVLVTTRSTRVARIMGSLDPYKLNDLGKIDSWLLFKHFAFKGGQELGVEAIGREIVEMCPKVPLVLRVVGQHLAENRTIEQWQAFKDQLVAKSSFEGRDMIMQTLKLSYDQLDEKLKLCVNYCSLFPKGWRFFKQELVLYWMALGYVESQNRRLEDVGKEYLQCLIDRGFLLGVPRFTSCFMHDVIHDLILSITQSKYQILDGKTSKIDDESVYHVSFHPDAVSNCVMLNVKQQLQSILILSPYRSPKFGILCEASTLISRFPYLKVLDLKNLMIENLPSCLGKLIHLRYLDLSWNDMSYLPKSITRLVNLLYLNLSYCKNLVELPKDMNKLMKLKHFLLTECSSLTHMPEGLGKLKDLQTLDTFIVGDCSGVKDNVTGELADLSDLNNLQGELTIIVGAESKSIESEARTTHLGRKDNLRELNVRFKETAKEHEKFLEQLQPQGSKLECLRIRGYGGKKLPSWMMNDELYRRLPNLSEIQMVYPHERCPDQLEWIPGFSKLEEQLMMGDLKLEFTNPKVDGLRVLTLRTLIIKDYLAAYQSCERPHQPLILLNSCFPNLHRLTLANITKLKVLPEQFRDLSSLKTLSIENCPRLKAIPAWIDTLTSLETLELIRCGKIKVIPDSIGSLTSLRKLTIYCEKVKSIPFGTLNSLQILNISCPKVTSIPDSIGSLTSLRWLYISCPKLKWLPHQISNLSPLVELYINQCSKVFVERCRKPTGVLWPLIQHFSHISIRHSDQNCEAFVMRMIPNLRNF